MDNVCLSAISVIAFCGGFIYYTLKSFDRARDLDEAQYQQVYSPKDLLKGFKLPDVQEYFARQEGPRRRNPHEFRFKTFVKGVVTCDRPLESIADKDVKLIHRVAYKEDIYSNSQFAERLNMRLGPKKDVEISAPLYFNLADPSTQGSCKVHRSMQANLESALEEISQRQVKRDLGWLEKGLISLGLSLEFIRNAMNFPMKTGIKIGWSEKEFGIKVGSTLTVYGEVIYNAVEGKLRIESPLYYALEGRNIIEHLKKKWDDETTSWLLMLAFMLISGYYLFQTLSDLRTPLRPEKKNSDKSSEIIAVKLKDNYICIKCGKKPRNVIMEPCQDLCLCKECYEQSGKKSCPICGLAINSSLEIYFC